MQWKNDTFINLGILLIIVGGLAMLIPNGTPQLAARGRAMYSRRFGF